MQEGSLGIPVGSSWYLIVDTTSIQRDTLSGHIEVHSNCVYTVVIANADGPCSTEWVVFTDTDN